MNRATYENHSCEEIDVIVREIFQELGSDVFFFLFKLQNMCIEKFLAGKMQDISIKN